MEGDWDEVFALVQGQETASTTLTRKRPRIEDSDRALADPPASISWRDFGKSFDDACSGFRGGGERLCRNCQRETSWHELNDRTGNIHGQIYATVRNLRRQRLLDLQQYPIDLPKATKRGRAVSVPIYEALKQLKTVLHEKEPDRLRLIMACDAVYYKLYYDSLEMRNPIIPYPVLYFGEGHTIRNDEKPSDDLFVRSFRDGKATHALERLHALRVHETNLLLRDHHHHPTDRTLRKDWLDSCRDYPCHLYAYATLSSRALDELAKELRGRIVYDVGAGTGYLASLLEQRGVAVHAYDQAPTTSTTFNEYHAAVPPFCHVHDMAELTSLDVVQPTTLLLCYPPPNDSMGYNIVKSFRRAFGNNRDDLSIVHIGEFRGFTGDHALERSLLKHFSVRHRLPCLTWGTDAAEVTVWYKKKKTKSILVPCVACGKESVKRCTQVRRLSLCSSSCLSVAVRSYQSTIQRYMALDIGVLQFDNPRDFSPVEDRTIA